MKENSKLITLKSTTSLLRRIFNRYIELFAFLIWKTKINFKQIYKIIVIYYLISFSDQLCQC